ncbi:phosphoribosylamine--glycine ligase [Salinispira pacifica]
MRILVIGSGAREHAITWKFARSKRTSGLFVAPGNAGTEDIASNLPDLDPSNSDKVARFCHDNRIDLVFVGPEEPLAAGMVDHLAESGISAFGPDSRAARLESSKSFAKQFMNANGIPTAGAREFSDFAECRSYLESQPHRVVLKKSGLAAGKGVLESTDRAQMLSFANEVLRNDTLLVEEYLSGFEVSIFALCDGNDYLLLPPCADYKKAGEGATGPNTGGLGSVCPVPWLDPAMVTRIQTEVVEPTFRGLREASLLYRGVLYFGLMITDDGPRLLEYNVRFGDPETQVLLPLIKSDMGNLSEAVVAGKLSEFPLNISDQCALGVVVASRGYPGSYKKGIKVEPIPQTSEKERLIFHASTQHDRSGGLRTGGGRCFTAVGIGSELLQARIEAYAAAQLVRFEGAWFRPDIGAKIFGN